MAKPQERQQAFFYYVEKGKSAKETAAIVGITEKTMSDWVTKSGWKTQREARAMSAESRAENIKQLIDHLAGQRMELGESLAAAIAVGDVGVEAAIRRQMAAIDDGAAKWNKSLDNIKKNSNIRLAVYYEVMEQIFNALRLFDEGLYLKTIDFQEAHVHEVSVKMNGL